MSIPYTPISFTATLNPSASVNFNEYYDTFVNRVSENQFARRTVVDIPKNIYLHDINSYFTADFEIARFDSVNRSGNQLGCEFDFCFYSQFDATYSWRLVTLQGSYSEIQ